MSTHIVCPICGLDMTCKGPHEGANEIIDSSAQCPLKKGAIYVFVKDDAGTPLGKVATYCGKQTPIGTDKDGFAFYEQLDEGPYPTGIVLEDSDTATVKDPHYTFVRTEVTANVQKGKITLVEFVLHRYATLQVEVKRTDNKKLVGQVQVHVEAAESKDSPPQTEEKSLESGPVPIHKLRPTGVYKVTITLVEIHDKKFKVSGSPEQSGIKVKPNAPNKIEFLVDPLFWIKFAIVEGNNTPAGQLNLQQTGKDAAKHDTTGDGKLELDELPAGKMKVNQIDLAESYEFVEIKPGD